MKKKKTSIYFIVPILGLIAFAGIYWKFSIDHEAVRIQREEAAAAARQAAADKALEDQRIAYTKAVEANDLRRKEREAREAMLAAEKEARVAAEERLSLVSNQASQLLPVISDRDSLASTLESDIAELKAKIESLTSQRGVILQAVEQATANKTQLDQIIQQLQAVQLQRAQAAALAAAQAGQNN